MRCSKSIPCNFEAIKVHGIRTEDGLLAARSVSAHQLQRHLQPLWIRCPQRYYRPVASPHDSFDTEAAENAGSNCIKLLDPRALIGLSQQARQLAVNLRIACELCDLRRPG